MSTLIESAERDIRKYREYLDEAIAVLSLLQELPESIKQLDGAGISSMNFSDELRIRIIFHQSSLPKEVDIVKALKTEGVTGLKPSGAWNAESCNYEGGQVVLPSGQEIKFEVFRGTVPPTCHIESKTEPKDVTTYEIICDQTNEVLV